MAAKSSNFPQAFMEGIDVRIADIDGYYDIGTEDYVSEVGNIRRYNRYDSVEDCWIVDVQMKDGEILEVLESEIVGYDAVSGKSSRKVIVDIEPMKAAPVALKSFRKPVGSPSLPASINGVKIFNMTPKKKKYKSIFQSQ